MTTGLRILHIFGKMDRGGAEMRTLDMMRALTGGETSPQIHFDYLVLSGSAGELDESIRQMGGQIFYLKLGLNFAKKFRRILKEGRYDVVHSHVHLFSGFLLKLAARESVSVRIAHLHTTGPTNGASVRRYFQNKLMIRWLSSYAHHLVPVSQGALDFFCVAAPRFAADPRLKLIYDAIEITKFSENSSGFDLRQHLNLKPSSKILIHVGRTDPVKNHEKILNVFSRMLDRDSDLDLVLVGASEPGRLSELRTLATKLGMEKNIHFLGSRNDVHALLRSSNLMIFPSHFEGLPGAVLEASALGIRVLCSDLPGCRELAKFFDTIEILSLVDSDDAWAEKAIECLQRESPDPAQAAKILDRSPFTLKQALFSWIDLWSAPHRMNSLQGNNQKVRQ